jgi:outer membrane murein-binding lipoprotein Lpp
MARGRITVAAIAAASVILAGCSSASSGSGSSGAPGSSSSSSSSTASDIASLPAEQIVSKAIASLRGAKSFRVAGTVVEGADRTDIDLGLTDTGSAGTVAVSGTEVQVIVIGTDGYFKASDAAWRKLLAGRPNVEAIVQLLRGKWIKGSSSDEQFAGLFSITKKSLVDGLAAEKGPFTKTATKVIAGQEAVGVTATDSTLYVSTKDARPLETEPLSGSTSSGKVTFTEYDAVPEPTPPPAEQTIDSSKLGG